MIEFSKNDRMKYISHLDLMRFFVRAFRRAGIDLLYSHGYNPHPKIGIAQPLSLGYASTGDLMEIETARELTEEERSSFISGMPKGLSIDAIQGIEPGKSLASRVTAAEFTAGIPLEGRPVPDDIDDRFISQESIVVTKPQKKKGLVEIDIKGMIRSLNTIKVDDNLFMTMELDAGSTSNLSPELVLQAFYRYMHWELKREKVEIIRTGLKM